MGNLRAVEKFFRFNKSTRRLEVQMWRKEMLPSFLFLSQSDVPTGLYTIPAAGTVPPLACFKQPYASMNGADAGVGLPFEARSLIFEDSTQGTANANYKVTLSMLGDTRLLMNRPIHIRNLFGTAQLPALLREPLFIPSQAQLQFAPSGQLLTSTLRPYLSGLQYYTWAPAFREFPEEKDRMVKLVKKWMERRKYVWPFWLTTNEDVVLTANQTASFDANIGDEGHFEIFTAVAVSTGEFSIQVTEVQSGQNLMNGQVTQTAGLGTAQYPMIFPTQYMVPAGLRLRLTLTNLTGSENTVNLAFVGRKIYAPFKDVDAVLQDTRIEPSVPTPADVDTPFIPQPLV